MKRVHLTFLLIFLTGTVTFAQGPGDQAVASATEALRKAMIDPDRATLERLVSPNLSYGHSNGLVEDRAAFVEALTSGKNDFVTIALSDQTVRVTGDIAVVRHKLVAQTNNEGKPGSANIAVLLVWQKQKNDWVLLARQAVKL